MTRHRAFFLLAIIFFFVLIAGIVFAQGGIQIERWVIGSSGGHVDNKNGVELNATLGQPVIGTANSGDVSISLVAGYLTSEKENRIFIPLLMRDP